VTYEETIQYLIQSYSVGKKVEFITLRAVLAEMGAPQEKLRVIHVAGTNGKGSVCAMLAAVLEASGYTTGLFTSPHLQRFNERLAVGGAYISDEDLAKHVTAVDTAMQKVLPAGASLSYFQILTLAAFAFFAAQKVDYVLLEAGIGGRLDSTNVIDECQLAVITSVGLDHMEILGGTIADIAREKSGILKENCPAVLYSCGGEVYNRVKETADARHVPLYCDKDAEIRVTKDAVDGIVFDVRTAYFAYENIKLNLSGVYQPVNACTALTAVHALREKGLTISDDAMRRGLAGACWPGRMEVVRQSPMIVLDGAHNPDAAALFKRSAQAYFAGRHVTAVIGVLRGKAYEALVNDLTAGADAVILTAPAYTAKATLPKTLYDALEDKNRLVMTESDYRRALETALRITPEDGVIVCAGSLYLVGDMREYILAGRGREAYR